MKSSHTVLIGMLTTLILGCNSNTQKLDANGTYSNVNVVGAMKHVMWNGELDGSIKLDTIANKVGLYGLGPESYLTGELLVNNGVSYVSRVTSDSTMTVQKSFDLMAPFFVYANVTQWQEVVVPANITSIQDLEMLIDQKTTAFKRPFTFKLIGTVTSAVIHIQNLPKGSTVSSPAQAHQGQINYDLENQEVQIIGFFSTEHKGIFTHHDSNVHLHLITKDEKMMGHLDKLEIKNMTLYLPER